MNDITKSLAITNLRDYNDCENILNFANHIDLDMMGSDFAMNGYISDYGYIELP